MLAVFMASNVAPGETLFAEHGDFVSGLYMALFMMNCHYWCCLQHGGSP
ncbi:MAG: hypothetical protein OXC62_03230 [Aestuariivita sp.]|nr:hypothetical protein [Aestuariivita sp.]